MANYMKKDYIIGICSVGEKYHPLTQNLIKQINEIINVDIIVLTDKPELFQNVQTIPYTRNIFSFHDKRLLFEEGFKSYDSVLLLDADHIIRDEKKQYIIDFTTKDLESGAYPQIVWKYPADCSMEFFIKELTPRVPYGKLFREFCGQKRYTFNNALLIQESLLLIKETR